MRFVLLRVNCSGKWNILCSSILEVFFPTQHNNNSSCTSQVDNGSSSSSLSLLLPLFIHSRPVRAATQARGMVKWGRKLIATRKVSVVVFFGNSIKRTFHFRREFPRFFQLGRAFMQHRRNNDGVKFVQLSLSVFTILWIWYVSNLTKLFLLCSRDIFEQFGSRFSG